GVVDTVDRAGGGVGQRQVKIEHHSTKHRPPMTPVSPREAALRIARPSMIIDRDRAEDRERSRHPRRAAPRWRPSRPPSDLRLYQPQLSVKRLTAGVIVRPPWNLPLLLAFR